MIRVGFIGLGLMGAPMAANVAQAGYPLTVYNRTLGKCDPLRNLGANVAATPREIAEASDVVITMLSNAAAVEQTLFSPEGVIAGIRPGMVVIDMSTIAPDESRGIAARLTSQSVAMLDAPVIGSTGPAKDGTLVIMVGGDKKVFDDHKALLGVMGKECYYMGCQGNGAQMKLSLNLIVAGQLASLCEAMLMAAKAGLDMDVAGRIIITSNLASNLLVRKVPAILQNNFQPGFPLKHLQKDLGLIVRTAESVGAPIYATSTIHQLYLAAKEKGYGEEDASALYQFLAEMAGLKS
jgi:3-hydroxyisobutyrate dehydrogenase-like beta-hydroxyacid dehydrogenase